MQTDMSFISQFSTKAVIPPVWVNGNYDHVQQRWVGCDLNQMGETYKKTEGILKSDSTHDWT